MTVVPLSGMSLENRNSMNPASNSLTRECEAPLATDRCSVWRSNLGCLSRDFVEGVGGLRVPLDPARAGLTVVELIMLLGFPVMVVAKPGLGTLNHTALTLEALVRAGAKIAGVLINGFDGAIAEEDPSVVSNAHWIQRMTGFPVIEALLQCPPETVRPHEGILNPNLLDAALGVDWMALMGRSVMRT